MGKIPPEISLLQAEQTQLSASPHNDGCLSSFINFGASLQSIMLPFLSYAWLRRW